MPVKKLLRLAASPQFSSQRQSWKLLHFSFPLQTLLMSGVPEVWIQDWWVGRDEQHVWFFSCLCWLLELGLVLGEQGLGVPDGESWTQARSAKSSISIGYKMDTMEKVQLFPHANKIIKYTLLLRRQQRTMLKDKQNKTKGEKSQNLRIFLYNLWNFYWFLLYQNVCNSYCVKLDIFYC